MTLNSISNQFIFLLKSFNSLIDRLTARRRIWGRGTPTDGTFFPVWHPGLSCYLDGRDSFTAFFFAKFINNQITQFFGGGLLHNSSLQFCKNFQRKNRQDFNQAQVAA